MTYAIDDAETSSACEILYACRGKIATDIRQEASRGRPDAQRLADLELTMSQVLLRLFKGSHMAGKAYLHDANIEAIEIDVVESRLRFHINRHPSPASRGRIKSTIEFRNVQSFSGTLDLVELASNAWAGNIEDWEPATGSGVSHLHFVRGVFSIQADEPTIS